MLKDAQFGDEKMVLRNYFLLQNILAFFFPFLIQFKGKSFFFLHPKNIFANRCGEIKKSHSVKINMCAHTCE